MTDSRTPVLWITGPAGVGKSTVAWLLFTGLAGSGTDVAFADADQLCMCYPPPRDDPGRDRIRAHNAAMVIRTYALAGAGRVIVNGVVDAVKGVDRDLIGQEALLVCRLRADKDETAGRIAGRYPRGEITADLLRQVRDEADRMDASGLADVCVDTTAMPAVVAAELVRETCRDWQGFRGLTRDQPSTVAADLGPAADGADGRVVLLCGPPGVGKSTIGFQLYLRCVRTGLRTGYIDLDQVGFLRPAPSWDPGLHRLKAANLAAMWRTYHAAGARHLVTTGPADDQAALDCYTRALPDAAVTACRLHAGTAELTRRIRSRGDGGSWPQPGDPLRGQSTSHLSRVAEQAAAKARALDRANLDAIRIDTDGLTAGQAADRIATMTRWPGQPDLTSQHAT